MKPQLCLATIALFSLGTVVEAGDCCARGDCAKVCKLVWTTKTIEKTCYGCECEEICLNGPNQRGREQCTDAGNCNLLCCLHWTEWCPTCADLYKRKKLVKYMVTYEVPSFRWVVVPQCQCDSGSLTKPAPETAHPGDELPLTEAEVKRVSAIVKLAPQMNPAPPRGRETH